MVVALTPFLLLKISIWGTFFSASACGTGEEGYNFLVHVIMMYYRHNVKITGFSEKH